MKKFDSIAINRHYDNARAIRETRNDSGLRGKSAEEALSLFANPRTKCALSPSRQADIRLKLHGHWTVVEVKTACGRLNELLEGKQDIIAFCPETTNAYPLERQFRMLTLEQFKAMLDGYSTSRFCKRGGSAYRTTKAGQIQLNTMPKQFPENVVGKNTGNQHLYDYLVDAMSVYPTFEEWLFAELGL